MRNSGIYNVGYKYIVQKIKNIPYHNDEASVITYVAMTSALQSCLEFFLNVAESFFWQFEQTKLLIKNVSNKLIVKICMTHLICFLENRYKLTIINILLVD